MLLSDVFRPEFIKVDIEAGEKDKVFEELVDFFCLKEGSNTRDKILEALLVREAKMSTGIHKGIAIPHGKTDAVDTVRGVLGISRKGVDYDSLDGEPVYLLFMLIAPMGDSEKQLRILKRLSDLLENAQFYREIQSQKNAQDVYDIIRKFEQ
ncbi:MAG: PTS sugar transporter subunit IIA [Treponema sp.]|nr:PTS sugar transporter subunit IIA [Treponema sp.]